MNEKLNEQDFIHISQMVHSITKLDIRLNDQDGHPILNLINHLIPSVLDHPADELVQIHDTLQKDNGHTYYHYSNPHGLEYMAAGIWKKHSFCGSILIGPLISSYSVSDLIKDIISKNNLPISERKQLEQFYQSLPMFNEAEYKSIGELVVNLFGQDFIHSEQVSVGANQADVRTTIPRITLEESREMIEQRYDYEANLMRAIAKGDKTKANQFVQLMMHLESFFDRVPSNPVRSSKNIAFVFNTLCRIAAGKSGIHPVYLDHISKRFAILIERTITLYQLKKLFTVMSNDYCDLVTTVSTGHYSPMVKNAVDFILLNLGSPLTLKTIADQIHANPSHLSRKFKQETDMTLTDFINLKRIEEAELYLQRGTSSVTEIAFMVGFNDLNYFSKVFKKLRLMTPTQYMKKYAINIKNNS